MNKNRFTLIELITAIVVISILAAIVMVQIQNVKDRAVTSFILANTKEFQTAVDRYYMDKEEYPVLNGSEITLDNPQYLDIRKLSEEGYLKKDLDLNKISTQHYKVDVFGRVWGASQPSLKNGILATSKEGDTQTFTVDVSEDIKSVAVYKVVNGNLVSAGEYQLSSYFADKESIGNGKIQYNQINDVDNGEHTMLKVSIEDTDGVYLFSGVDKYGLENAPVGHGYNPENFGPIRGGEGEYEYMLESYTVKEWIDFITVQDTPEDSSITYQFAVKEEVNGEYGEWSDDFHALPNAYGIKVKIIMKRGLSGAKPSLYALRILYKNEGEDVPKPMTPSGEEDESEPSGGSGKPEIKYGGGNPTKDKEVNTCPPSSVLSGTQDGYTVSVYTYKLAPTNIVSSMDIPNANDPSIEKILIEYSNGGTINQSVETFLDIPAGSCFNVIFFKKDMKNLSKEKNPPLPPLITEGDPKDKEKKRPKIKEIKPEGSGYPTDLDEKDPKPKGGIPKGVNPDDPEVYNEEWETIDDIRFFQHGSSGQTVWYGYTYSEDVIQDKTRILYRFATGNGYYWANESDEFPAEAKSNALLVHVYFQIHKSELSNTEIPDPKLNWLKVHSSDGTFDLDLNRPTMAIYPEKNNNIGRDTISNASEITWKFEAEDPNGLAIKNFEWNTTAASGKMKYPVGKHSIKGRVQNEHGLWSNWTTYEFDVLEEKPIADFTGNNGKFYFYFDQQTKFDPSPSIDPDGDRIVDYEWKGKKESYSKSEVGKVQISLRVKDEEGNWSDWKTKDVYILDSELDFWFVDGQPANSIGMGESFDRNETTRNIYNSGYISWGKNIEGETLHVALSSYSSNGNYHDAKIAFYNDNGESLWTLNNKDQYLKEHVLQGRDVSFRIVVPKGATSMNIENNYSINSIYIVKEGAKTTSVSNLNYTATPYSFKINWNKPSEVVKTYFIAEGDNLIKGISTTSELSLTNIQSNDTIDYKVISVDKDFIASEISKYSLKTKEASVEFYGADPAAFDEDLNTQFKMRNGDITWNKDISGETLYVNLVSFSSNGNYYKTKITFYDKANNPLYALNSRDEYLQTADMQSQRFEPNTGVSFIVPDGAVRMNIVDASSINSIYLVNYKNEVMPIGNIEVDSTSFENSASWTKPKEVTKTYFIANNKLMGNSVGETILMKTIDPNTKTTYTIISVNADFNASDKIYRDITTKPVEINLYGASIGAFDYDNSTTVSFAGGDISWDKDISGRKLYLNLSSVLSYGTPKNMTISFQNASGENLPFEVVNENTVSSLVFKGTGVSKTVIVPEGAVKMNLKDIRLINSIYLVD